MCSNPKRVFSFLLKNTFHYALFMFVVIIIFFFYNFLMLILLTCVVYNNLCITVDKNKKTATTKIYKLVGSQAAHNDRPTFPRSGHKCAIGPVVTSKAQQICLNQFNTPLLFIIKRQLKHSIESRQVDLGSLYELKQCRKRDVSQLGFLFYFLPYFCCGGQMARAMGHGKT